MVSTGAPRAVRIVHAGLVAGLSIVGATFLVLRRALHMDFGVGAGLGRVFAVMSLVVLAVALFFCAPGFRSAAAINHPTSIGPLVRVGMPPSFSGRSSKERAWWVG